MGCIACAALVLDGTGLTLTRRESSPAPVVADSICPDRFVGRGLTEIAALPVVYAGREVPLGDVFEVDGAGADNVTVCGDLSGVEGIGRGMTMGRLTLTCDVGARVGEQMAGGEIVVQGAAGDGLGVEMSGGRIVVQGDAGREVGARMSGGLIVVLGDAGDSAGAGMTAGALVVGGRLGRSAAAGMAGGTLVAFGEAPALPPTFRDAGLDRPAFLLAHAPDLEAAGLVKSPWIPDGQFRRFVGDVESAGGGEVLVRDQSE